MEEETPEDEMDIPNSSKITVDDHEIEDWKIDMALDIVDKQYRLYSWSDSKTASLITTNSILLAVIGFSFKECLEDVFSVVAMTISLVAVSLSLYFSLRQVIPQGSSGKATSSKPNVRALSGILKYDSWTTYFDDLSRLSKKEFLEANARQIFGMSRNVNESRKMTTVGVRLTLVGIIFMCLAVVGASLSSNDIHIFGEWAASTSETNTIEEKQAENQIQVSSDNEVNRQFILDTTKFDTTITNKSK
jgi:hypothetical protein